MSTEPNYFGYLGKRIFGTPFIGGFIRFLHFKKVIKKLEFNSVLDAGCGDGSFSFYLINNLPNIKVDAWDAKISEGLLKNNRFGNLKFVEKDLHSLDVKDKYDFIFSIDVLEHIKGNRQILERLSKALKKGGYLFIHVPHKYMEFWLINKKHLKDFCGFESKEHVGDMYTIKSLEEVLKDLKLNILTINYSFGFFGGIAWEIGQYLQEKRYGKIKITLIPALKILGYIDTIYPNNNGNGICALCKKI